MTEEAAVGALLPLPHRARARLLAARRARAPALPAPLPGDRAAAAPGGRLARARRRTRPTASCPSRSPSSSPSAPAATRSSSRRRFRDLVERGALERRNGGWELAVADGRARDPRARPGNAAGAARPARPPDARGALARRGHRAHVRPAAARAARRPRRAAAGAHGAAAARPDRREAPPPEPRVPLPPRPRPGGRLREPRRADSAASSTSASARRSRRSTRSRPRRSTGCSRATSTEADEPEKAVDYLLKAGDAARAVYADQEALEHYRKARAFLARLGDERRARDTLFKMALAYHLAFDFESAEEMYDEAFCCRVARIRACRADRAPRDGVAAARRARPRRRLHDRGRLLRPSPLPRAPDGRLAS